jgi:hypothetical protein
MNYQQELHAWPIGKAGYTMKTLTLVSLRGIVAVMKLAFKPNKSAKNVSAIIKELISSYKKQNHPFGIKIRNPDYL